MALVTPSDEIYKTLRAAERTDVWVRFVDELPSLAKEGCREAAGWFDQEINYQTNTTPAFGHPSSAEEGSIASGPSVNLNGQDSRSRRAIRLEVSHRRPPIDCTSA